MWTSLIGFMGSGKSTLTGRLALLTNRPAASLDDLVAAEAGLSPAEIFAREGEAAFRRRELQALQSLDPGRRLLVDTGGGIVHVPEAVDLLRRRGVVIWIDAAWPVIRERLAAQDAEPRPLAAQLGWDGLQELYRRRRPLYAAAADFRLKSDLNPVELLARRAMLRSLLWQRRERG